MKIIVIAFCLAVLGIIGYTLLQGECRGGVVFASEAECASKLGAAPCRSAFAASERAAFEDRAPFATLESCAREFERCAPHRAVKSGFVPVPASVCVAGTGSNVTGSPIYRRIGASLK